jgi:hypothetical protein
LSGLLYPLSYFIFCLTTSQNIGYFPVVGNS